MGMPPNIAMAKPKTNARRMLRASSHKPRRQREIMVCLVQKAAAKREAARMVPQWRLFS
jgi:hypothetical protein